MTPSAVVFGCASRDASARVLLAASLLPALGVAALSWFAVERPALRFKARAMGRRIIGMKPTDP